MAASGIAEHDEARRRERGYLRKAWLRKQTDGATSRGQTSGQMAAEQRADRGTSNSYDVEVQRMQNLGQLGSGYDPATVDKERRAAHYRQMQQEYSAKINGRYSSIDYVSQW